MKTMFRNLLLALALFLAFQVEGQHTAFGLQGGLSVATQRWNQQEREAMLGYHADAVLEFFSDWDEGKTTPSRKSFVVMAGYHQRGTNFRVQYFDLNTQTQVRTNLAMRFDNVSLALGAKQAFRLGDNFSTYYQLALRGDYNVAHEFEVYQTFEEGIRKFTFGVNLGGGLELTMPSAPVAFVLEARVAPDFSNQIYIPTNEYYNAFTRQNQTFPEQKIRNLVFEVSLGFRLIRKVEYID